MFKINPALAVDSYKVGHIFQYEEDTQFIYSNFTARSAKHAFMAGCVPEKDFKGVVIAGLQMIIKAYLVDFWDEGFFFKDASEVVPRYHRLVSTLLGKDFPVQHIYDLHELGYLPIHVRTLPDGTVCPIGVPFFTIENTLEKYFWLTNYLETALSALIWKPITSATNTYYFRKMLEEQAEITGSPKAFVPYQGHDFSLRGLSGLDDGALVGAGHLVNFCGTDNLIGLDVVERYYHADNVRQWVGASVDATEHSVMCLRGKEGEADLIRRLIEDRPDGILSMVVDGFDFFEAIDVTLPSMKDLILSRDGKIVVRPDSGDPADIICGTMSIFSENFQTILFHGKDHLEFVQAGDKYYRVKIMDSRDNISKEFDLADGSVVLGNGFLQLFFEVPFSEVSRESLGAIRILAHHFGTVTLESGYKLLNEKIGLIYGDSIRYQTALDILTRLRLAGYGSIPVFGLGSYFFQYHTRDTYGMAIKGTHAVVDGDDIEMQKDPATGDGTKKSLKGYIRVQKNADGQLIALDQQHSPNSDTLLLSMFVDGNLYNHNFLSMSQIRTNLHGWDDRRDPDMVEFLDSIVTT